MSQYSLNWINTLKPREIMDEIDAKPRLSDIVIIDDKESIKIHRLCTLKGALKLEILGMKRRGRSAYSIIKEEFNLKGNRKKVLKDFTTIIEANKKGS